MMASPTSRSGRGFRKTGMLIAILICVSSTTWLLACPFCSAPARTLSEDLAASDIVVFAKLVEKGVVGADPMATATDQRGEAKFEIIKQIKGKEHLAGNTKIEAFYFGDAEPGAQFLITGMVLPEIKWTTPLPLSARGEKYVSSLLTLPEKGPDRLSFFWGFLEDEDSLLAQDSYDEFARASYADVVALKGKLDREKLINWINSPDLAQSRRRLYFTLLGVCGQPEDIVMLEDMMKSNDRRAKAGLDALIGCYLALNGPQGMPLVEDLFLKKKDAEYSDTYAAIMALRVMGQESEVVPRPRLLEALRYMLERPDLADLVIPDLARWEDWSVMDRMVKLFKDANPGSNFVRVPVVNYLEAASRQKNETGEKAKAAIDELATIDPEAVKRAKAYAIFGALAGPKPAATSDTKPAEGDKKAAEKKESSPAAEKSPAPAPASKKAASGTKQPAAAPDKSGQLPMSTKISLVNYQEPATEEPAAEPTATTPAASEPATSTPPANDLPAASVEETPANQSEAEAEAALEQAALETPVIVEEVEIATTPLQPSPGQTLNLDQAIGGRRIASVVGLVAVVLVGLRFVASRVGAPSAD